MSDKPPDKPQSSRREFLRGRAAVDALAHAAGPQDEAPDGTAPAEPQGLLLRLARNAMATEFQVLLNARQHEGAEEAACEALDLIEQLEDQLSVYREHSEVSRLNARAAGQSQAVEPRLFGLLELAAELHRDSDGAFDLTATPLSRAWGFQRRQGRVPDPDELAAAQALVDGGAVRLNAARHEVRFVKPGLEINLGAIGKGYALDRAAETLLLAGVDDFLIHGGRSSVLASGSQQGAAGWSVGLMHPLRPQQRLALLGLQDRALGTSGCGSQFFHHQGRRLSHILDPRSGRPAEGVLSATVWADTAAEADALATAAYVLGVDGTAELLARRPRLSALLVLPGRRSGAVALEALNLPDEAWCTV